MGFHVGEEGGVAVVVVVVIVTGTGTGSGGGGFVLEVRMEFDLIDRGRGGGCGEGGFEVVGEVVGDADGEGFAGGFDGFHGVPGGLKVGGRGGEERRVDEVAVWEGSGGLAVDPVFLGGFFKMIPVLSRPESRRREFLDVGPGEKHTGRRNPIVISSSSAQSQQGYPRSF